MTAASPFAQTQEMAARHGLLVGAVLSLSPEHFLPQRHLPSVVALYIEAGSAEVGAAHRKLHARTQSRHILPPRSLLHRGPVARREWSLAIPPLLTPAHQRADANTSRRIAFLVDGRAGASEWQHEMPTLADLGVHSPKAKLRTIVS